MGLGRRIVIMTVALWLATLLVPGISVTSQGIGPAVVALVLAGALFGAVNLVVKPLVKVVGCPVYVLTLGLFALVVNGLLLWLTSALAGRLHIAFHVAGFTAAFWGAILVGLVSWLLSIVAPGGK